MTNNSTFRVDGYRDAEQGNRFSPPCFSVHAQEYQEGYNSFFTCEQDTVKDRDAELRAVRDYAAAHCGKESRAR